MERKLKSIQNQLEIKLTSTEINSKSNEISLKSIEIMLQHFIQKPAHQNFHPIQAPKIVWGRGGAQD